MLETDIFYIVCTERYWVRHRLLVSKDLRQPAVGQVGIVLDNKHCVLTTLGTVTNACRIAMT